MDNLTGKDKTLYLLAALIEIYRGSPVFLPETDPGAEKNILKDVFSSAISFARFDESRKTLSEEIFKCNSEGSSIVEQMKLVKTQTPDVLNAKMVAAAHLIKILNPEKYKLS